MKSRTNPRTTLEQRAALLRLLGDARLQSYRAASSTSPGTAGDEIDCYVFNMALASGFLGPLHILEVVVRNAVHSELVKHTGQDAWWESPRLTLVRRQIDEIHNARRRHLRSGAEPTAVPSPDDMVAALEFGFWCGLLGRGRPATGADYERDIWQPAVQRAFPNYRGTRGDLARHLNALRILRNRISHHEPIHTRDCRRDFDQVIRLLSHISRDVAEWVEDHSALPEILAHPPGSQASATAF